MAYTFTNRPDVRLGASDYRLLNFHDKSHGTRKHQQRNLPIGGNFSSAHKRR